MKNREHQMQCAVIQWARMAGGRLPALRRLFAIPNGGHRNIAVAAKLKAEGVRAGVPDLCLPVARGDFHGLFIEMKAKPNTPTPAQKVEMDALRDDGYCVQVCYEVGQAIAWLEWYVEGAHMPHSDRPHPSPLPQEREKKTPARK